MTGIYQTLPVFICLSWYLTAISIQNTAKAQESG